VPPPTPDPEAVRAEIEAFEAGAARAARDDQRIRSGDEAGLGKSVENR
jgi:hypothetical protein